MKKKSLEKNLHDLWKQAKNDFDTVVKEGSVIAKKSEKYLKEKSKEGKKQLEALTLALKREKLFYELGKALSKIPKGKKIINKKAQIILKDIRKVNAQIRRKKG